MDKELLCGPCAVSRKKSKSVSWCMQCDEGLCSNCLDHHQRMKLSRDHTIIDADQYEKLPSFIQQIKTACKDHQRQLELYCPAHKVTCCVQCIAYDHPKCIGMTSIETLATTSKSTIQELERDIESVLEDSTKVIRSRSNNLNRILEQETRIKAEISSVRFKMNDHLNMLEAKMMTELETIKSKETANIGKTLRELNERQEIMTSYKKDLKGIKLNATDLQAFHGIRHISSKVSDYKGYLQNLEDSKTSFDVDLSFEKSPKVTSMLDNLNSLGKINANVHFSPLKIVHRAVSSRAKSMTIPKTREVTFRSGKTSLSTIPEIDASKKEIDVRKISLLFQKKIAIPVGQLGMISSLVRLADKKIVAAESSYKNGHLFLFNTAGRFLREIKVKGDPWGITQLDDVTIAVTYPDEKCIKFINFMTCEVVDSVPLNKSGWGILNDGDVIYVGLRGSELRELDYYGNKIGNTTIRSKLENFHIFRDRIYYTDAKKNTLHCASLSGDVIWSHQNEYMKGPQSVTTDKFGNIFVACEDSHAIVVVPPDKSKIRYLLGKSAGLERPISMYCDTENSMLLISNRNGKFAGMFKIVYK